MIGLSLTYRTQIPSTFPLPPTYLNRKWYKRIIWLQLPNQSCQLSSSSSFLLYSNVCLASAITTPLILVNRFCLVLALPVCVCSLVLSPSRALPWLKYQNLRSFLLVSFLVCDRFVIFSAINSIAHPRKRPLILRLLVEEPLNSSFCSAECPCTSMLLAVTSRHVRKREG